MAANRWDSSTRRKAQQCTTPFKKGHGYNDKERLQWYFDNAARTSNGCWEWANGKDRHGYGRVVYQGKVHFAHRLSYVHHVGPIPQDLCVCHHCDNPSCVNPEHLFIGSANDNNQDMIRKGRDRKGKPTGQKNPAAKLTDLQVTEIKRIYAKKSGVRGTCAQLSVQFNVSIANICYIVKGLTWQHITNPQGPSDE